MKTLNLLTIILASLWFSACTHTGTPETPKPESEETREETSEAKPASSETAESKAQDAREPSQPSQTASQDATEKEQKEAGKAGADRQPARPDASEAKPQEAREQPQTGQAPSADTAGATPKKAEDRAGAVRTSSPDTADARLEEARKNLRLSEETEKRISSDLEQLKKSGNASPEAIKDYEAYLQSVQAMTAENRRIVEQMEAAYARKSPVKDGSNDAFSGDKDEMADPDIPEEQTMDEVAALDRKLNASLASFDDMLLKEMDAIREGSSKKLQDLAEEAAEAAKRLREKGVDTGSSGSESPEQADEQKQKSESDQEAGSSEDTAGSETASSGGSSKGGQGPARDDQRRAGYEDDDIVARQLREAAENETDPELKEKLWKEYEEYKKSR